MRWCGCERRCRRGRICWSVSRCWSESGGRRRSRRMRWSERRCRRGRICWSVSRCWSESGGRRRSRRMRWSESRCRRGRICWSVSRRWSESGGRRRCACFSRSGCGCNTGIHRWYLDVQSCQWRHRYDGVVVCKSRISSNGVLLRVACLTYGLSCRKGLAGIIERCDVTSDDVRASGAIVGKFAERYAVVKSDIDAGIGFEESSFDGNRPRYG